MIFAGEAGPCFHIIDHGGGLDLDVLLCIISGKRFSTCSSLGMGFPSWSALQKKLRSIPQNRAPYLFFNLILTG